MKRNHLYIMYIQVLFDKNNLHPSNTVCQTFRILVWFSILIFVSRKRFILAYFPTLDEFLAFINNNNMLLSHPGRYTEVDMFTQTNM